MALRPVGWRGRAAHVPAIGFFIALSLAFSYPLCRHLPDGLLGVAAGDNVASAWNFWWAHQALWSDASPIWTPALFAPLGTSLVLHTASWIPAYPTVLLLPGAGVVTQYNLAVLATIFLNGICAYAAALILARDRLAAALAGVVFAGAPFLMMRLNGHLNVLSAWGLPLLIVALDALHRRPTLRAAVAVGTIVGALGYLDYYYLVFGLLLGGGDVLLRCSRITLVRSALTPRRRRVATALVAMLIIVVAAILYIASTGGGELRLGGVHVSFHHTFNARVATGVLFAALLLVWAWPTIEIRRSDLHGPPLHLFALALGVAALLLAPLIMAGTQLWLEGDYASQAYHWRSAPSGIDVGSLLLGNPLHPWWGGAVSAVYDSFGINRAESAAWLGGVPLALLGVAWVRYRHVDDVRRWLWIAAFFTLWALGPYLMVLGANSGVMLPQTLLRFVPVLSNARIPGRAFVVSLLAVALLAAMVVATLRKGRRGWMLGTGAIVLTLIDYLPAPYPVLRLDTPPIYERFEGLPAGAVLDVPLGVRDGFGARGRLNHRVLFYQTIHGRPIFGGFVARLSPRVKAAYAHDPVLRRLLQLSSDATDALPETAGGRRAGAVSSLACAARYVVLDRKRATLEMERFLNEAFLLRRLADDGARRLYLVERVRAVRCSQSDTPG
ncbi:MAG: hypothetical protein GEV06_19115 [Luteitalea sp.]|nr:hypothetical protein [Luteitalea sp.]